MHSGTVLDRRELYPICSDMMDEWNLETQEAASYILFPQEHHRETCSIYPIGEDTNSEIRQ
jgi:hypothetical protein